MRLKHFYLITAATTVMSAVVMATPVRAQDTPAPAASDTPDKEATSGQSEIVVTGVRASLMSAQQRKRDASQIVDSIVAEDIGKLPDQSTTDALQRVTGVQIERDYGEGSTVYVRGLSQVETTLNGREIFTAQGARGLNLQDIPAELLSGIDVYKSPSANLIEGGLGGLIDLRTRRPLDFNKLTISGTVKGTYADLAKELTPTVSGLIADKWETGAGEIGALLSVSYQERKFRSDLISTGTPGSSTTIIPGRTVIAPNGAYDVTPMGDRRRLGIDGMLQWKPSANLELYVEGHYAKFINLNDNYGASVSLGGLTAEPGAQVAPNGDVVKATYLNAPVSVLSYAYDTRDRMIQFAGGAKWTSGPLSLAADVSYTHATGTVVFNSGFTGATIPRFTADTTTFVPSANANGYDLLSQANTSIDFLLYQGTRNKADQFAAKLDGSYDLGGGFLHSIDFGLRYADRTAQSNQYSFFLFSGASATTAPSILAPNPASDFFARSSQGTPLLGNYLVIPVPLLRDHLSEVQSALGFASTPPANGPLAYYRVSEKTTTLYGMLRFGSADSIVDGNIGLRYVHTQENLNGNRTLSGGGVGPISVNSSYDDFLPSVNVRFNFTDKLKLRLAASKAVTRPNFSDLSPTLTLNSVQLNGSAGNPDLKPLKADQLDASLEYYFSRTGSIYVAAFYKKVRNFISIEPSVETYDGITYTISRPANNQGGTIKGLEVGYQQFFDFLPGPLSGLGAQANFTLVDSSTTSSIIGQTTPLQGLSKYTYNLVGIYEKYGVSARVAYNWRSTYFDSTYLFNGVGQPSYRRGYGWLAASLSYDVTPHVTISLEGNNLTRVIRRSYYNDLDTRPHETQVDDRQIMFGVRFKL
ncbi:TonB-dependent receptor [Sphingomonas pruni]|jgi:TonB-dependent receptor|uniref:TonB-dependent receptor n=1 Tax=Sphingomonas pruni TaxID=40683 RepID=UPI00083000B9|nr:TonB-dependent receptor [Sphingomonas pruni]